MLYIIAELLDNEGKHDKYRLYDTETDEYLDADDYLISSIQKINKDLKVHTKTPRIHFNNKISNPTYVTAIRIVGDKLVVVQYDGKIHYIDMHEIDKYDISNINDIDTLDTKYTATMNTCQNMHNIADRFELVKPEDIGNVNSVISNMAEDKFCTYVQLAKAVEKEYYIKLLNQQLSIFSDIIYLNYNDQRVHGISQLGIVEVYNKSKVNYLLFNFTTEDEFNYITQLDNILYKSNGYKSFMKNGYTKTTDIKDISGIEPEYIIAAGKLGIIIIYTSIYTYINNRVRFESTIKCIPYCSFKNINELEEKCNRMMPNLAIKDTIIEFYDTIEYYRVSSKYEISSNFDTNKIRDLKSRVRSIKNDLYNVYMTSIKPLSSFKYLEYRYIDTEDDSKTLFPNISIYSVMGDYYTSRFNSNSINIIQQSKMPLMVAYDNKNKYKVALTTLAYAILMDKEIIPKSQLMISNEFLNLMMGNVIYVDINDNKMSVRLSYFLIEFNMDRLLAYSNKILNYVRKFNMITGSVLKSTIDGCIESWEDNTSIELPKNHIVYIKYPKSTEQAYKKLTITTQPDYIAIVTEEGKIDDIYSMPNADPSYINLIGECKVPGAEIYIKLIND